MNRVFLYYRYSHSPEIFSPLPKYEISMLRLDLFLSVYEVRPERSISILVRKESLHSRFYIIVYIWYLHKYGDNITKLQNYILTEDFSFENGNEQLRKSSGKSYILSTQF